MDRVLRDDLDDVERVDETLVLIQLDQQPLLVRVQERHRLTATQHNNSYLASQGRLGSRVVSVLDSGAELGLG